jgi:hypothetical protein
VESLHIDGLVCFRVRIFFNYMSITMFFSMFMSLYGRWTREEEHLFSNLDLYSKLQNW